MITLTLGLGDLEGLDKAKSYVQQGAQDDDAAEPKSEAQCLEISTR